MVLPLSLPQAAVHLRLKQILNGYLKIAPQPAGNKSDFYITLVSSELRSSSAVIKEREAFALLGFTPDEILSFIQKFDHYKSSGGPLCLAEAVSPDFLSRFFFGELPPAIFQDSLALGLESS
jgi:hypothetical protein